MTFSKFYKSTDLHITKLSSTQYKMLFVISQSLDEHLLHLLSVSYRRARLQASPQKEVKLMTSGISTDMPN